MEELFQLFMVLNKISPSNVWLIPIDMKSLIYQCHLKEPMKIKNLHVSDIHGPNSIQWTFH